MKNTLRCNIQRHFNLELAVRKNSRLPNLHNLGILLRILIIVNMLAVLAAILQANTLNAFLPLLAELSTVAQPIFLLSLLCLYGLYPLLNKLEYWQSVFIIFVLEISITILLATVTKHYLTFELVSNPYRAVILCVFITAIVLYYFHLLQRAYFPAIVESRLQALQARIRPHFLFNSISAVLSLIRTKPKQAETALEDMADLFRVLMAENRDLVPLKNEIALCKQYLSLESLRLEERLNIKWNINNIPDNVLIPPLILQPLVENAVYHGIEPLPNGGEITVSVESKNSELYIEINNPYSADINHHAGNKMAIKNIKERLQLHFDLESSLSSKIKNKQYSVYIRLPLTAN